MASCLLSGDSRLIGRGIARVRLTNLMLQFAFSFLSADADYRCKGDRIGCFLIKLRALASSGNR